MQEALYRYGGRIKSTTSMESLSAIIQSVPMSNQMLFLSHLLKDSETGYSRKDLNFLVQRHTNGTEDQWVTNGKSQPLRFWAHGYRLFRLTVFGTGIFSHSALVLTILVPSLVRSCSSSSST